MRYSARWPRARPNPLNGFCKIVPSHLYLDRIEAALKVSVDVFKKLPDVLVEYVLEFFRGDFKTLSRFLQTRKSIHNKYNSNLAVLKRLWLDIQNIRGIDGSMKEQLYKTYFYTTFTINSYIGAEEMKHLAEALKVNTSLETINLYNNNIGDEGKQLLRDAWKESGKSYGLSSG